LPAHDDTSAVRATFGDFTLQANVSVADLCDFYGLKAPTDAELPVDLWLAKVLKRPLVVGDRAPLDYAELSVRSMVDGEVTTVGLKLPLAAEEVPQEPS
jgi:cell volume regulation protein A